MKAAAIFRTLGLRIRDTIVSAFPNKPITMIRIVSVAVVTTAISENLSQRTIPRVKPSKRPPTIFWFSLTWPIPWFLQWHYDCSGPWRDETDEAMTQYEYHIQVAGQESQVSMDSPWLERNLYSQKSMTPLTPLFWLNWRWLEDIKMCVSVDEFVSVEDLLLVLSSNRKLGVNWAQLSFTILGPQRAN